MKLQQTTIPFNITVKTITSAILSKMSKIAKPERKFMLHIFVLLLSLRGRFNFLNLARYGKYNEKTYRKNFEKAFSFSAFNHTLIEEHCSKELGIIFDPSYLPKSGKKTPGCGYFWSGCAGAPKWGIELGGIAVVDFENHTAMHYIAEQTIVDKVHQEGLLAHYVATIKKYAEKLLQLSTTLYVDAFFSKAPFVNPILELGFQVVSRLQSNAYLRYRYQNTAKDDTKKKFGRPKTFDGKVNPKNVCEKHFKLIKQEADERIYEGEAHSRALGRWIKVVIVQNLKDGKIKNANIFFSTDLSMSGLDIYQNYKARFQIEFIFRDTKQHIGLTHCESRSRQAIHFHSNTALTTLNLAKIAHWLDKPKEHRGAFSIADVKTQYVNELILDELILIYGKDPKIEKSNPLILNLYNRGKIAA